MTDNNDTETADEPAEVGRRRVLASAVGLATAGAAGYYAGTETASAAPEGVFPVDSEDALLKIRTDRIELVERSTDPTDPDAGTLWYNGGA